MKTVIGHGNEKSSKSEREMKKLYDLNPFVRFVWHVNTHVHCNNRVLPAEVSGICYEHEPISIKYLSTNNDGTYVQILFS